MTTPEDTAEDPATLPERIGEAVSAHSCVLRLDGGEFGTIVTPLPGRQVTGVRLPGPGESAEIGVVLRLDRPLPEILGELREQVRSVAGPIAVDVTVSDVVIEQASLPEADRAGSRGPWQS